MKIKTKLQEDTLGQAAEAEIKQAEKDLNATAVTSDDEEFELEQELTHSLSRAHRARKYNTGEKAINILIVGEAGSGKTERVEQWAQKHGVNLVYLRAGTLDEADFGGVITPGDNGAAKRLASTDFDALERPNSVLFLDEFNRARPEVRGNLLELINHHVVPDPRVPNNNRYLPNYMFTIAAINPSDPNYDVNEMDAAEIDRFKFYYHTPKNREFKAYYIKKLNRWLDEAKKANDIEYMTELINKINMVNLLMDSKDFEFDSSKDISASRQNGNGKQLSPRSLEQALNDCDGTKENFYKTFKANCNSIKLPKIQNILANYKEVDDKATQALDNHETESDVFSSRRNKIDKFKTTLLDI